MSHDVKLKADAVAAVRGTAHRAATVLAVARRFPSAPNGSGLRTVEGDSGMPLLGHLPAIVGNQAGWAGRRYRKYGPVSWMGLFSRQTVLAVGPDATEAIFTNRDKAFGNADAYELATGPFVRRGLLLQEFEEHLQHRRVMQEAFTRDRLEGYLAAMGPHIESTLAAWQQGPAVRLEPAVRSLSLDIADKIFLGDILGDEAAEFTRAFKVMLAASAAPVRFGLPGSKWSKGLRARRHLEQVIAARIAGKRADDGQDLFSAMCHARSAEGEVFSDEDIVNHMIFLLFASHDTSTSTMANMCYRLARHPEWMRRCRAESLALGKPMLDYDDLAELPSLELVMKESLRLIVPLPITFRSTVKDTELLGYHLPKGTFVLLCPQYTHSMPEFWPNPGRFDPERFSPERREDKVHRYAWAPFGGGVHKCIGMYFAGLEVKSVLHQMLLGFDWSVDPGYRTEFDFTTLPFPKDGLPVALRRR